MISFWCAGKKEKKNVCLVACGHRSTTIGNESNLMALLDDVQHQRQCANHTLLCVVGGYRDSSTTVVVQSVVANKLVLDEAEWHAESRGERGTAKIRLLRQNERHANNTYL